MLQLDRSRERMVTFQLAARGIIDARVLAAMRTVPRERFVSAGFEEFAYEDGALPIEEGQTISQPYIVARMIEAADLEDDACVLEIGTGSGYAAAVLSRIVDKVYTMERHATLANAARLRLCEGF
jgi:protein-L-isoaspartate(D-aspartate) O-methyltransferase